MSVFLDPGHSGINDSSITKQVPNGRDGMKDCGTTGTSTNDGYPEHSFNWDVATLGDHRMPFRVRGRRRSVVANVNTLT